MKSLTLALFGLLFARCAPPESNSAGVYMLVDTSGTYREERQKAQQIIR